MPAESKPLKVVVLSCSELGFEVARRLVGINNLDSVSLITAPYKRKQLSIAARIRHVHRTQGWPGLLSVVTDKIIRLLWSLVSQRSQSQQVTFSAPLISHFHFKDFHDKECLETMERLDLDLGVVAGTHILKKEVFEMPRLGSINLHTGKAPEYRGAAPAFWELYNGESEVGITIHRVSALLDEGAILHQEVFPLEKAPKGDPMEYLDYYRREVLIPNGIRMLAEVVERIANGTVTESQQDHSKAKTYRSPDYNAIKELRRRVVRRRQHEQVI